MSIDLGKAVNYPFKDDDWVSKMAITIVLGIIPVLGWFLIAGYMVRAIARVMNGDETLPAYDDWGGDFMRGLVATFGSLIYYAPIILVICCVNVAFEDSTPVQCCAALFYIIYGIVTIPLIVSALARYAATEEVGAFMDIPGRIRDFTNHMGDAIMLVVMFFIVGLVISILAIIGYVLCIIPGLIVTAASYYIQAHMVGQWGQVIGAGGDTVCSSPRTSKFKACKAPCYRELS